ncbi:PrsW family intramembrane metalloprotease [Streptomyces sp. NBC_01007]|nr:PrsW family intramembrane metalloprotease [Streptomyces sp. NBC_01007]
MLGATPGSGFAALESAGHAFDAAVSLRGVDLRTLLEAEVPRGVPTPFGHGPWTAVTGAVPLAHRRPDRRFWLTVPALGTRPRISLPHALRDSRTGSPCGWWRGRAARDSTGRRSVRAGRRGPPARRTTSSRRSRWAARSSSRSRGWPGRARRHTATLLGEIPPRGIVW